MLVNKPALFLIFFSCVSTTIYGIAAARNHGAASSASVTVDETVLKSESHLHHHHQRAMRSSMGGLKARIGSRPPSCINKCDSCTPCQAVQASQSLAEMTTNIGSRPPSCQNKCNRCIPCQAVQVPTGPIQRTAKPPSLHHHQQQQHQEVSVEYSNYKPEGWRCKCGNKLFNP